jgi:hypothetical protein
MEASERLRDFRLALMRCGVRLWSVGKGGRTSERGPER